MTSIILMLLLAILPPPAILALSTTETAPGQTLIATAVGDHLELRAPAGFVVGAPTIAAGVTSWRITVTTAAPRLTPYQIALYQDGVLVDTRGLRVCCEQWPDALPPRLWLPMIRQ